MNTMIRNCLPLRRPIGIKVKRSYGDEIPKGGGEGSIREAGGAFGKMEASNEEGYFYRKQRKQLEALKQEAIKAEEAKKSNKAT